MLCPYHIIVSIVLSVTPIITPMKKRGFIDHGSGLECLKECKDMTRGDSHCNFSSSWLKGPLSGAPIHSSCSPKGRRTQMIETYIPDTINIIVFGP